MNLALKAALFLGIGLNLGGCFGDDKKAATNKPSAKQNREMATGGTLIEQFSPILENGNRSVSSDSVLGYYLVMAEIDGFQMQYYMKVENDKFSLAIVCSDAYIEGSAEIDLSLGSLIFKEDLEALSVSGSEGSCEFRGFSEGEIIDYRLSTEWGEVLVELTEPGEPEGFSFLKVSDL